MELKEFKEKTQSKVVDIIANLGVFTLSEIMDIEDIREAKKSFDELSDLINEYIEENDKPKFEVGDYVTSYIKHGDLTSTWVGKVEEIYNYTAEGTFYHVEKNKIRLEGNVSFDTSRLATQEEIAEYKAALQFHEHGRKPFEIKEGDINSSNDGYKILVDDTCFWGKEDFVSGNYTLLKTSEEIEAWLSDGKTDIG